MRYLLILRYGLAFVFLANAINGIFNPSDFKEAIEKTVIFAGILNILPYFPTLVGINDFAISLLLFTNLFPNIAAKWASAWLAIVILVLFTQGGWGIVDAMEHLGFLSIALVLYINSIPSSR